MPLLHEELSGAVLGAFYHTYDHTGLGFSEALYHRALVLDLQEVGLHVETEVPFRVCYNRHAIGHYRLDILVEEKIVIECKAAVKIAPPHEAQLLNYLTATGLGLGFVLNFGPAPTFKRLVRNARPIGGTRMTMERLVRTPTDTRRRTATRTVADTHGQITDTDQN